MYMYMVWGDTHTHVWWYCRAHTCAWWWWGMCMCLREEGMYMAQRAHEDQRATFRSLFFSHGSGDIPWIVRLVQHRLFQPPHCLPHLLSSIKCFPLGLHASLCAAWERLPVRWLWLSAVSPSSKGEPGRETRDQRPHPQQLRVDILGLGKWLVFFFFFVIFLFLKSLDRNRDFVSVAGHKEIQVEQECYVNSIVRDLVFARWSAPGKGISHVLQFPECR